ncbi:MFS transporter [Pseudonocardia acaciae]|uniref:MFS transporter n=1 Tax=Pseudonocardia acaciae TaxID=551276 RepID=UPI00055AEA69|nr:MFS transporter [Pseudonocardia acaciae]
MSDTSRQPRTAALAALSGQTIEYYDFVLYGTAAALVLGDLFFPSGDPVASKVAAFATFAIGFLCRPVGGILFGHFGDRLGRKNTLVVTLLLMGGATTLIGALPTYAAVGVWAPIMLLVLRLLQGIALGGEWGGATLLAVEHAPKSRRALYGSIPQLGSPAGLLLSTVVLLLAGLLPDEAFRTWGWRVPFLFSAVLLVVGLVIRLRVEESPDFTAARTPEPGTRGTQGERIPLVRVLKAAPRAVVFGMMAALLSSGGYYLINTYTVSYVVDQLGLSSSVGLVGQVVNAVVQAALVLFVGQWGTTRSPRILIAVSAVLMAGWAFPLYALMQVGAPMAIWFGLAVATVFQTGVWALLPTLLSSQFPVRVRYTGISLCFQGATAIGGFSPLVATLVSSRTGGNPWAVATLLAAVALIAGIGAFGLRATWSDSSESEPADASVTP